MAGIIGTIVRHAGKRITNPHLGLGLGLNAAFSGVDYMARRAEGESGGQAAMGALGTFALWEFAPQLAIAKMAYDVGEGTARAGYEAYQYGKSKRSHMTNPFGRDFIDTANRQTMRQRAMRSAMESGANVRQVLGNEARMINRHGLSGGM